MTIENDLEENKRRLELLRLARQLLNEQYIKDRTSAYVQWSTDSDKMWKEQGVKLPFPPTPAMPSEADVVAKALELYNQMNTPKEEAPKSVEETKPEVKVEVAEETKPEVKVEEPVIEVEPVKEPEPVAVETIPNAQPTLTTITNTHGSADLDVAETTIKEIFNAPAIDLTLPDLPDSSVAPTTTNTIKKRLFPSWIKPGHTKESH